MKTNRLPSYIIATLAWLFVFLIALFLLLGKIQSTSTVWVIFLLMFFTAAVVGSSLTDKRASNKSTTDIEVNINGLIYSEKQNNLKVFIGKEKTIVFVDNLAPEKKK